LKKKVFTIFLDSRQYLCNPKKPNLSERYDGTGFWTCPNIIIHESHPISKFLCGIEKFQGKYFCPKTMAQTIKYIKEEINKALNHQRLGISLISIQKKDDFVDQS